MTSCGCRLCGDGGSRNLRRRARLCGDLVVWRAGSAACRHVGSASTGAAESNTANCVCTFRRNGAGWSGGVAKPGCGCASPAGLRPSDHHAASRRDRVGDPLLRRCSLRSQEPAREATPPASLPRTADVTAPDRKIEKPQAATAPKDTQTAASVTRTVAPPKTKSSAALTVAERPQAASRPLKPPAQEAAKTEIAEPSPRPAEKPVVAQPLLAPAVAAPRESAAAAPLPQPATRTTEPPPAVALTQVPDRPQAAVSIAQATRTTGREIRHAEPPPAPRPAKGSGCAAVAAAGGTSPR